MHLRILFAPVTLLALVLAFALWSSFGCGPLPPSSEAAALRRAFPDQSAPVLEATAAFVFTEDGFEDDKARRSDREGARIRLPRRGDGAIRFTLPGGLEARVHEVGAVGEGAIAESAVAYPRAGGTSFWASAEHGYEEWLMLSAGAVRRDRAAVAWEVEGAALVQRGDAIDLVDEHGSGRLRVTAPLAYAARGRPIATRIAAQGRRIELWVDAEGEDVLVDPKWTPTGAMATNREGHTVTLLDDGRALVAGGWGGWSVYFLTASAEIYDPKLATWTAAATMHTPHAQHTATRLQDGRVLIVGGWKDDGSGEMAGAEVYDPKSGTWTNTTPMVTPRRLHTATLLPDGRVLAAGGRTQDLSALTYAEIYDPTTNAWTKTAPMNTHRELHTATLLSDGRVLVAGGDGAKMWSGAELYDPAGGGSWWSAGLMSTPRSGHTATLLDDGRVLVAGGYSGWLDADVLDTAELYDPAGGGSFKPTGFMIGARFGATATRLDDGRVLVTGGASGSAEYPLPVSSAEIYDPATGYFASAGSMSVAREDHAATRLLDGRVLVVGGRDKFSVFSSVDVFDIVIGRFQPGAMSAPRYRHTATRLLDGRVLVIGGRNGDGVLASAEIYDPGGGGRWTPAGSMSRPRAGHTATLLPDGRVLVIGGAAEHIHSGQIYDPAEGGKWSDDLYPPPVYPEHTATLLGSGFSVLVLNGASRKATVFDLEPLSLTETQPMHATRVGDAATWIPGVGVLVAGGGFGLSDATAKVIRDVEIYDAAGKTTQIVEPMHDPRIYFTATLLNNGLTLMAGGADAWNAGEAESVLSSVEVYSPANGGAVRVIGSMRDPRYWHTATLLHDGRAFITGGADKSGKAMASTEIFDAVAETWTPGRSMSAARVQHTTTLLDDGRVLVVGGRASLADGAPSLSTVELFTLEPQGSPCMSSDDCQSGFCVDGVCCDTACDMGSCDACSSAAGARANGACTMLDNFCGLFTLDKTSCSLPQPVCLTSCASVNDCKPDYVCDPSHRCVPPPPRTSSEDYGDCSLAPSSITDSPRRARLEPGLVLLVMLGLLQRRARRRRRANQTPPSLATSVT